MHSIIALLAVLCLSGLTASTVSAAASLELNAQALKDLAAAADKLSKSPTAPKTVTVKSGGKDVVLNLAIGADGGLQVKSTDGSFNSTLKFAYDGRNELVVQVKDPGQPVRYVRTQGNNVQGWAQGTGDSDNVTRMGYLFAAGKTVTGFSEASSAYESSPDFNSNWHMQKELDRYMFSGGKLYSSAIFAVVNQNNANLTQQIVSGTLSGAISP
jgi:hypothetical protein